MDLGFLDKSLVLRTADVQHPEEGAVANISGGNVVGGVGDAHDALLEIVSPRTRWLRLDWMPSTGFKEE
jgi:hypothetical protein